MGPWVHHFWGVLMKKVVKAGLGAMAALALSACSAKEAVTPATDSTTPTGGTSAPTSAEGQAVAEAESFEDLKLAGAFEIDLPDALEGGSSGSSLVGSKRSQEACMLGETIKEVTQRVQSVGNFACHIEAESDKIKFGKKYKIVFAGQEFGRVYVDDSKIASGIITFGMCGSGDGGDGDYNRELITITGLTDSGPVGSIHNEGGFTYDGQASTYKSAMTFDMSEEGVMVLSAEQAHNQGENSFVRSVDVTLREAGLNVLSLASRGTWGGGGFSERGVAMLEGEYGSAILENSGTYQGNEYSFTRRAFFSEDGLVATEADVDADALVTAETTLPEFLAATFSPESASGWVGEGCPDFDEVVELDPESPAHAACDGNRDHSQADCWSQDDFESGESIEVAE